MEQCPSVSGEWIPFFSLDGQNSTGIPSNRVSIFSYTPSLSSPFPYAGGIQSVHLLCPYCPYW